MNIARRNPHIYEINTRAWLVKLSRRYGTAMTLKDIPDIEWDRLRDQGFDYVWLMGVWNSSPESRKSKAFEPGLLLAYAEALPDWTKEDVVGSPYAIYDYQPCTICGTLDDLARARQALHERGIRLILDFVPNHLAFDHPLVTRQPSLFIQADQQARETVPQLFFSVDHAGETLSIAHGKDPHFDPWTDTAQLNYFSTRTRSMMMNLLLDVSSVCDGVRCDMAMLVLNDVHARTWGWLLERQGYTSPRREFWSEAIQAVRDRSPDFCFIAEVYWGLEWTLQQLGFDYTYDKTLYDRLRHHAPTEIYAHLQAAPSYRERSLRFIENHDEERALTVFGQDKMMAATVCIMTLPGMRFVHDGQIDGLSKRLPVQLVRARDENSNANIRSYCERIMSISNMQVFHEGQWRLLDASTAWPGNDSFRSLLVWDWLMTEGHMVVVINFSNQRSQGRVFLDGLSFAGRMVDVHDLLCGNTFRMAGSEIDALGLYIDLDAWQSHILKPSLPPQ